LEQLSYCKQVTASEEPPFLPATTKNFTLVLDLDETLIHYIDSDQGEFLIRPNCRSFLELMAKYYEIVIFTAAMQDYADWVLD
jgi:CTD small phosphatase-like protein 2